MPSSPGPNLCAPLYLKRGLAATAVSPIPIQGVEQRGVGMRDLLRLAHQRVQLAPLLLSEAPVVVPGHQYVQGFLKVRRQHPHLVVFGALSAHLTHPPLRVSPPRTRAESAPGG